LHAAKRRRVKRRWWVGQLVRQTGGLAKTLSSDGGINGALRQISLSALPFPLHSLPVLYHKRHRAINARRYRCSTWRKLADGAASCVCVHEEQISRHME
jgi:hypothetical protein